MRPPDPRLTTHRAALDGRIPPYGGDVGDNEKSGPRTGTPSNRGVHCSTALFRSGRSYWQTLDLLPNGHRLSALDEIAYYIARQSPALLRTSCAEEAVFRGVLFRDLLESSCTLWEWTHVCLRAPKGSESFRRHTERNSQGRNFYRADYVLGEVVLEEGLLIPEGCGEGVREWHDKLPIPAATAHERDEPANIRFYFDPTENDVAVLLCRTSAGVTSEPCIGMVAQHRRSLTTRFSAYRLFEGTLDDFVMILSASKEG